MGGLNSTGAKGQQHTRIGMGRRFVGVGVPCKFRGCRRPRRGAGCSAPPAVVEAAAAVTRRRAAASLLLHHARRHGRRCCWRRVPAAPWLSSAPHCLSRGAAWRAAARAGVQLSAPRACGGMLHDAPQAGARGGRRRACGGAWGVGDQAWHVPGALQLARGCCRGTPKAVLAAPPGLRARAGRAGAAAAIARGGHHTGPH